MGGPPPVARAAVPVRREPLRRQPELRTWHPAPSDRRQQALADLLGWRRGSELDAVLDWVDPVTPLADYAHRRRLGLRPGLEDIPLLLGLAPSRRLVRQGILMGQRIPPYRRTPSTAADYAREIDEVLRTGHSSRGRLWRSDLGDITLDLGVPGNPAKGYKGGWGLSHIRDKRTDVDEIDGDRFVREILPRLLAEGRLKGFAGRDKNRRVVIDTKDHEAALRRYRYGRKDIVEDWLLSAYPKRKR